MEPIYYADERYECPSCSQAIPLAAISNAWACSVCNSVVHIYATNGRGLKQVLKRVREHQLKEDDLVVSGNFDHIFPIIEIGRRDDGFTLALRGYRRIRYPSDQLIECVIGAW